jgi:hypothetical protein
MVMLEACTSRLRGSPNIGTSERPWSSQTKLHPKQPLGKSRSTAVSRKDPSHRVPEIFCGPCVNLITNAVSQCDQISFGVLSGPSNAYRRLCSGHRRVTCAGKLLSASRLTAIHQGLWHHAFVSVTRSTSNGGGYACKATHHSH